MGLFKTDEEKKQEYIKKGLEYANKSEYEKAVKEFENALKLFPKDEEALFNLGFIYSDMQQYGLAYDILKKLVNINPHHIEAFNNLGLLFARQAKYTDAIFVYEKGVEQNPGAAVLFNNLGNVYYDTGKFEKALQMFKKAGELDPVFTERLYHLGIDSFIKGTGESMDDAIVKLQESAKLNVNKAKASHDLGVAYIDRHMHDKAIEAFNQAIIIDPNYLSAYINLGYAYQHKEDYDSAVKAFEKALILNPKSAKIYNTIGLIFDKKEQPDIAVKMYKKAVALDPTYANSHYMLGQLYQNRGNIDKAVAEFTKHIRIHETGNMVEDAMQRIADMKKMPFDEVKELFSLYIEKPEGMTKPAAPPPQMEQRDEKDYMKNLKEKMADKKIVPPFPVPQQQVNQPAAPSFAPGPANTAASPQPQPPKTLDPNEYMKQMKEKMKRKMAGLPEEPVKPALSPVVVAPPPQVPVIIQKPVEIPRPPKPMAPPDIEVLHEPDTGSIIDLPPRPVDSPWQQPQQPVFETPAADMEEYQHSQDSAQKPRFDTGASAPENYMETVIKAPGGAELPTDQMPEFKKQPHPKPVLNVEPVHGSSINPVGSISPVGAAGTAPLSHRMPNIPPPGQHKVSHSNMPSYENEEQNTENREPGKKDDDGSGKPKIKHDFW
jgi:tetratricopeptide (TPR) repeat protein